MLTPSQVESAKRPADVHRRDTDDRGPTISQEKIAFPLLTKHVMMTKWICLATPLLSLTAPSHMLVQATISFGDIDLLEEQQDELHNMRMLHCRHSKRAMEAVKGVDSSATNRGVTHGSLVLHDKLDRVSVARSV